MKAAKQMIRLIALTLVFVLLLGSGALAGWQNNNGKWWYSLDDGSYAKNQWVKDGVDWYYFGEDGYMVTGWKTIDGKDYYFTKDGKMATGWVMIKKEWYHFSLKGLADTGWLRDRGNWYYLDNSGKMMTGWVKDGQNRYYMNTDGTMATGWQKINRIWYHLDKKTGAAATGWKQLDGAWYYFDKDGRMFSNSYIDRKYYVDENGKWDGVTITDIPDNDPTKYHVGGGTNASTTKLTFCQNGWYVARLEVQVWDKAKQSFEWVYSDSKCKGGVATMNIDNSKYEISRVGFQVWYFGWDNFYFNLPWADTQHATVFELSGYGDYPKFSW